MSKASRYYRATEPSLGHTAIYKIHKYFARRPHNQFRSLIRHYVPPDGVVLDCFAGGGVTLVEALTLGRRALSIDINPIASLVQRAQVLEVPAARTISFSDELVQRIPAEHRAWYVTECSECRDDADVRWFEHAYLVNCPACGERTSLANENKALDRQGKARNGFYACSACGATYASVDVKRTGSELLNVRFRCGHCGSHRTKSATDNDARIFQLVCDAEARICADFGLTVPRDPIPRNWDRQAEDALSRKGFETFADFFTPRNRLIMAHLFEALGDLRPSLSEEEFIGVLVTLSALLRYVNNMTFTTSSWMDGRPVAWAKHAYWTPNQFVEGNPFEYLRHRQVALSKAQTDRRGRFVGKRHSVDPSDILEGRADYAVMCTDARQLDLPDESVDAVITDPPFGGNVQYGELTHFWSVWLDGLNPYKVPLFDLTDEILVHRKRRSSGKDFDDYRQGLREVFRECRRVLKPGGVMVFTFNNSNVEAWFAVMSAAFDAGFYLDPAGVHYQDEIKAYRDTAHLRFDGELQGDVLYTFEKSDRQVLNDRKLTDRISWLKEYISLMPEADDSATAIALHLEVVRRAAAALQAGAKESTALEWLELLRVASRRSGRSTDSVRARCESWLESMETAQP